MKAGEIIVVAVMLFYTITQPNQHRRTIMGSKPKKVEQPPDPDPTPMTSSSSAKEVQSAGREERKRVARNYGRNQTILAGNTAQDNGNKKTILGG